MEKTGKSGGRARIALSPPEIHRRLGCRRMMGRDGGIMLSRHRAIRPSPRALIADGRPLFLATFQRSRWPGDGVPKKVDIDPSLSPIRERKGGSVNWRGADRDIRVYRIGGIMDNRHRAGRPSFRDLLEAEGPQFPAPLPRRRGAHGAAKMGKRGDINPRLGAGRRDPGAAAIGRDFIARIAEGSIWEITAAPDDHLPVT